MMIALQKQARTTPAVRVEIAASSESVAALASCYNVTEMIIRKWKSRSEFHDRSHTAHRLQTNLTPAQEAIVVYLRRTLLLPLDDLWAVTREFLCPTVSRSGLDRCLRRHGVGNLSSCCRQPRRWSISPSRPTCRVTCTWTSNTCRRWQTKPPVAISSWPSTTPSDGCTSQSSPTKRRPPPGHS